MIATVVHIRRDALTVKRAITAHCYVYIGRPSPWGNPFTHKAGTIAQHVVPLDEVLVRYEEWLREQDQLIARLSELRGKVLGCWCKPRACHGDVLVKLIGELDQMRNT